MTQTAPDKRLSLGELVARLTDHLSSLIRDEIALAKAQLARKAQQSMLGAMAFAVAGLLAFLALCLLITAAVLGLSVVWPPWLAALAVAGVLLLLAVIGVLVGKRALQSPMPDPAANLKLDVEAVRQGVQA